MKKSASRGECSLCNGTFAKAGMRRHLESCRARKDLRPAEGGRGKTRLLHLVVEGRYLPEYWIHLEVEAPAMLKDLDGFLRDIWLECCGHLSAFNIEGERYVSEVEESRFADFEEKRMDVRMGEVLREGTKFEHEYDFGTTTELALKVVSEREGSRNESVRLLARNEPPLIPCGLCGKDAAWVCTQCIYTAEGWLCDECADKHECGENQLLPVVNSPRVGMCGYTG